MIDLTAVTNRITALTDQVQKTKGVQASAKLALQNALATQGEAIKAAVIKALEEDEAANAATVESVTAAIDPIIAEVAASTDDLATAIPQNP